MRQRFAAIVRKPVHTLRYDRGTRISAKFFNKLATARERSAVILTSPSSVKSFFVKSVELPNVLKGLEDALEGGSSSSFEFLAHLGLSSSSTPAQKKKVEASLQRELQRCVAISNLFADGVLIADEVDLVLHPLKSGILPLLLFINQSFVYYSPNSPLSLSPLLPSPELNWPTVQKSPLQFTTEGERWKFVLHLLNGILGAIAPNPHLMREYRDSVAAKEALLALRDEMNMGVGFYQLQVKGGWGLKRNVIFF